MAQLTSRQQAVFYLVGIMNEVCNFSHWSGFLIIAEKCMVITNRWQRALLVFNMF